MGCSSRASLVAVVVSLLACRNPPPAPVVSNTARPAPPVQQTIVMSSPGPLAAPHELLACESCHAGSAPTVNGRCETCHDGLANDTGGKVVHAAPDVRAQSCAMCHRDHKGRSYDMTR